MICSRPSEDVYEVAFAGLLHDVGKCAQRAGVSIDDRFYGYCPVRNGRASHLHAAYTAAFVAAAIKRQGFFSENILAFAARHHEEDPSSLPPGARAVQAADRIASGMTRGEWEEYAAGVSEAEAARQADYKRSRLVSVFSGIRLTPETGDAERYVTPPVRLSYDVLPVPLDADGTRKDAEREYAALWQGFIDELGHLASFDCRDWWYDALASLCELYFWSVPASSYKTVPDESLYDHLRMTSGLASALYLYHAATGSGLSDKELEKGEPFLWIEGDVKGIQSFIFSARGEAPDRYAAKILRARSFFVSMLCEAAAREVCRAAALPSACILLNAGGRFTVVAPNTEDARRAAEKAGEAMDRELFDRTWGETRFVLSCTPAAVDDLTAERFRAFMRHSRAALDSRKLSPPVYTPVFTDYLEAMKGKTPCRICGRGPGEGEENLCSSCEADRRLGTDIVSGKGVVLLSQACRGGYPLVAGWRCKFHSMKPPVSAGEAVYDIKPDLEFRGIGKKGVAGYVPCLEEEDVRRYGKIASGRGLPPGWTEEKEDDPTVLRFPKQFLHIAWDGLEETGEGAWRGRDFLGVLKADVDRLGEIFMRGVERPNISKYASLSRMMDFFFTGWLRHTIASAYPSVYTVFAGGDDLFLIGPWKAMQDLARELRSRFRSYTCGNPDVTISAALLTVKPSFPLRRAAERVECLLEKAKGFVSGGGRRKDALAVDGYVLPWKEFADLLDKGDAVADLLRAEEISFSYLYALMHLARMREKMRKDPLQARWRAMWRQLTYRNYDKSELLEKLCMIPEWIETHGERLCVAFARAAYSLRTY